MKYNYRIEFLDIGGKRSFIFRLPDEIRVVEIFLNSDIQSEFIGKKIIEYCNQVRNGQLEEKSFTSNNCSTTITPNCVKIIDMYSEENNSTSIETDELILLIEAFINEKKKHSVQCVYTDLRNS